MSTSEDHPYLITREALEEVVGDIAELAQQIEASKTNIAHTFGAETEQLRSAKDALADQEQALRQRLAAARAALVPMELKLASLREQERTLRGTLKPMAVAQVQPWKAPDSVAYTPQTSVVAGVEMRKFRQARILNEERAADILAGVSYAPQAGFGTLKEPRPLVTAHIVYDFYLAGVRAWLLEDIRRIVPGVLELTALDDSASWRMRLVQPDPADPPADPADPTD